MSTHIRWKGVPHLRSGFGGVRAYTHVLANLLVSFSNFCGSCTIRSYKIVDNL
jgi:hypothetical protein